MANLVITSSEGLITVEYNDYAPLPGNEESFFHKGRIIVGNKLYSKDVIEIKLEISESPIMSFSVGLVPGDDIMIVDTVNGVVPTDIGHLKNLLKGLMKDSA